MKKNLPISLLILFTVITVLSCTTSYQNLLQQQRLYSNKKTEQKGSSHFIDGLIKYTGLLHLENKTVYKLIKHQCCDRNTGSSLQGYIFSMKDIVSDEIWTNETDAVDGGSPGVLLTISLMNLYPVNTRKEMKG